MLSGYEFELANEIHQERLQRTTRIRRQAQAADNLQASTSNWMASVRHRMRRLHLFWRGKGKMQSSRMMQ